MRLLTALVAAVALATAGCREGNERSSRVTTTGAAAQSDVGVLVESIDRIHPDPWRNVRERDFRREAHGLEARYGSATAEERLVGLMRLAALLGDRNGHTGIHPVHSDLSVHVYPLYVYAFSDGLHVVASVGRDDLLGARVTAIGGTPADEALDAVAEIVPRDNAWSQLQRATVTLPVAEVLAGLGIVDDVGPAEFALELPGGKATEVALDPIPLEAYQRGLSDDFAHFTWGLPARDDVLALSRPHEPHWLTTLDRGRTLYLGYNQTTGDVSAIAERLLRLARRERTERVIVDVRTNGGGDNTTYWPLVYALSARAVDRPGRLLCLTSRATFSAAGNFVTDLEAEAEHLVLVGEPPGGGVNQYGDAVPVTLPESGWTLHVAPEYVEKGGPHDRRLALEPDVPVEWSSEDWLAGRDPVLEAALAYEP